jgi:hypothetical protein
MTSNIGGDVTIQIDQLKQKLYGPYKAYLKGLLSTHPHLQVLERFVDEDDWENWRICGYPKDLGLTKFDVIVVDIELSPGPPAATSLRISPLLESGEALTRYTEEHSLKNPGSLRLFLAEDLSRDLIEYFGSRYKLDPNFFEGHLRGHEKLLSGRPLPKYLCAVHPTPPAVSEACAASLIVPRLYSRKREISWLTIVGSMLWSTKS